MPEKYLAKAGKINLSNACIVCMQINSQTVWNLHAGAISFLDFYAQIVDRTIFSHIRIFKENLISMPVLCIDVGAKNKNNANGTCFNYTL